MNAFPPAYLQSPRLPNGPRDQKANAMKTPPDPTPSPDESAAAFAGLCPDELLLAAWCDGTLTEGERDSLEVHVAACVRCAELLRDLRGELEEAGSSFELVGSESLERAVNLVPPPRSWRFIAFRVAAVAAAIALVPLGLWIGSSLSQSLSGTSSFAIAKDTIADNRDDTSSSRFASLSAGYEEASSDPLDLLGLSIEERSAS
jgi:anti-sigma factor RsiW